MNHRRKRIAIVAYTLWEYAGKPEGRDWEFWFVAERIIPSPLPWGWEQPERTKERQKMNNELRHGPGDRIWEMRTRCDCDICQYNRKVAEVVASRDPDRLIEVVNELMDVNYNVTDDLDYLRCILDGSWPSAVDQLEKALERAKVHPNRKIDAAVHYG